MLKIYVFPGVQIKWIKEPPDVIKYGLEFNATAELILTPEFYSWGYLQDIFIGINGSAGATSVIKSYFIISFQE